MKTRCLQLMTIFMAIIGLNAAVLVGYILIYSQFAGDFPQPEKKESSGIMTAQSESLSTALSLETPNTLQNNILQSDTTTENRSVNTAGNGTAYSYDPIKQQLFDKLQTQREVLSQEQQRFNSAQNVQNNFSSDSDTSSIYTPVQNSYNTSVPAQNLQESLPPVQNLQEQVPTVSDILEISDTGFATNIIPDIAYSNNNDIVSSNDDNTGTPNYSGNSDNFHTHYNPHLQQTTDKYVLNTYSQVFHLPRCDDVARMAEKNYATSNNSYEDIISQGYRPCGHLLM